MNILLAILYCWLCGLRIGSRLLCSGLLCAGLLCAGLLCAGLLCAGLGRAHASVSSVARALSLTGPTRDSVCLGALSAANGFSEAAWKTPANRFRELQRNVPSTAGPSTAVRATRLLWLLV